MRFRLKEEHGDPTERLEKDKWINWVIHVRGVVWPRGKTIGLGGGHLSWMICKHICMLYVRLCYVHIVFLGHVHV